MDWAYGYDAEDVEDFLFAPREDWDTYLYEEGELKAHDRKLAARDPFAHLNDEELLTLDSVTLSQHLANSGNGNIQVAEMFQPGSATVLAMTNDVPARADSIRMRAEARSILSFAIPDSGEFALNTAVELDDTTSFRKTTSVTTTMKTVRPQTSSLIPTGQLGVVGKALVRIGETLAMLPPGTSEQVVRSWEILLGSLWGITDVLDVPGLRPVPYRTGYKQQVATYFKLAHTIYFNPALAQKIIPLKYAAGRIVYPDQAAVDHLRNYQLARLFSMNLLSGIPPLEQDAALNRLIFRQRPGEWLVARQTSTALPVVTDKQLKAVAKPKLMAFVGGAIGYITSPDFGKRLDAAVERAFIGNTAREFGDVGLELYLNRMVRTLELAAREMRAPPVLSSAPLATESAAFVEESPVAVRARAKMIKSRATTATSEAKGFISHIIASLTEGATHQITGTETALIRAATSLLRELKDRYIAEEQMPDVRYLVRNLANIKSKHVMFRWIAEKADTDEKAATRALSWARGWEAPKGVRRFSNEWFIWVLFLEPDYREYYAKALQYMSGVAWRQQADGLRDAARGAGSALALSTLGARIANTNKMFYSDYYTTRSALSKNLRHSDYEDAIFFVLGRMTNKMVVKADKGLVSYRYRDMFRQVSDWVVSHGGREVKFSRAATIEQLHTEFSAPLRAHGILDSSHFFELLGTKLRRVASDMCRDLNLVSPTDAQFSVEEVRDKEVKGETTPATSAKPVDRGDVSVGLKFTGGVDAAARLATELAGQATRLNLPVTPLVHGLIAEAAAAAPVEPPLEQVADDDAIFDLEALLADAKIVDDPEGDFWRSRDSVGYDAEMLESYDESAAAREHGTFAEHVAANTVKPMEWYVAALSNDMVDDSGQAGNEDAGDFIAGRQ